MRKALHTLASIFLALILFAWCTLPAEGTKQNAAQFHITFVRLVA